VKNTFGLVKKMENKNECNQCGGETSTTSMYDETMTCNNCGARQ